MFSHVSVCLFTPTRVRPSQVRTGGTPYQVRTGGTPFPGQDGGGGHPIPVQMGGYPISGQDRGLSPTGTAWRVLASQVAVCLLRSRIRTFLLMVDCGRFSQKAQVE